jgi:hypothetical protein
LDKVIPRPTALRAVGKNCRCPKVAVYARFREVTRDLCLHMYDIKDIIFKLIKKKLIKFFVKDLNLHFVLKNV